MAHHLDEEALELCIRDSALSCGYPLLKDQQKQVVLSFCKGKDIFACLPTGFGKSACFVILPKLFDLLKKESPGHSIVIVISPLNSLMKDQVRSCQERGVAAAAVTHDDKSSEEEAMKGGFQIVYISPEMILGTKKWCSVLDSNLYQSRLVGLVIDEAHCVKTW